MITISYNITISVTSRQSNSVPMCLKRFITRRDNVIIFFCASTNYAAFFVHIIDENDIKRTDIDSAGDNDVTFFC